jgi:hypothetical protein
MKPIRQGVNVPAQASQSSALCALHCHSRTSNLRPRGRLRSPATPVLRYVVVRHAPGATALPAFDQSAAELMHGFARRRSACPRCRRRAVQKQYEDQGTLKGKKGRRPHDVPLVLLPLGGHANRTSPPGGSIVSLIFHRCWRQSKMGVIALAPWNAQRVLAVENTRCKPGCFMTH